jgi:23S rRNA pseudouridine1911/1915/1917 synthase
VRQQVANSQVRVNQVVCLDAARRLKAGDLVEIGTAKTRHIPLADQIRILHVDRHLAVIDKPSGLTSERRPEERHWPARRKALQPTLDELLPRILSGRVPSSRRPAGGVILVHRLDRDTSGVMVVARTAEAAQGLTSQFRRHSAERVYRAIVVGHPGTVTIESLLVRDRGDGLRGSADAPVGKSAITHVREIEQIGEFSMIECRLETGRTNQIRIHLAERNCPVCGEVKYNRRRDGTVIEDASQSPRLALHAAELAFLHPVSQQPLRFLSPWPPELEALVASLRSADEAND